MRDCEEWVDKNVYLQEHSHYLEIKFIDAMTSIQIALNKILI